MKRLFQVHRLRRTESLDGFWDFVPDRKGLGRREKWRRAFPARSERMAVPGCWDSLPEYYDYHGKAWYRRSLHVPARCNLLLTFEGFGGLATLWFDGKPAGCSTLTAMPFELLLKSVAPGPHEIVIEIDNSKPLETVFPNYGCDWFHYGGIVRSAEVAFLGDLRIRELRAHYTLEGRKVRLAPEIIIENLSRRELRDELLLELNGVELARIPVLLPPGTTTSIRRELPPRTLALWSPDSPALHTLRAQCAGDDLADRTGFRSLAARNGRIILNGKPLKLLGVNRHDEYGDCGWAVPPDMLRRDFQLIRDLGCNAVRCHYPITALGMDLCDEMGFLVWSEIPFYARWPKVVGRTDYLALAENALESMVRRDCNRPSIFLWSVQNESATNTPEGARAAARLVRKARALDTTRPIGYASNHGPADKGFRPLDVIGINSYPGWYDEARFAPWPEMLSKLRDKLDRLGKPGVPILITETGAAGLYGDRSFEDRKWSEPFQARLLEQHLKALLPHKDVAGVFIWQFSDIRTIREYWRNRPGTFNNKGLVDRFRRPKEAYWRVQDIYRAHQQR